MISIALMIIIFVIYFLFPNNNLSLDSYGYAGNVKYGEDLFYAHHLLYNLFNHIIYRVVSLVFLGVDALKLMQAINALFSLISLYIVRKLIIKHSHNIRRANIWTFFIASSFGVMRFSVEAETYIIPIFFSILSTYFYFVYSIEKKITPLILCSIFISIACLFHQIHLFWGIGFFIGLLFTSKLKHVFIFSTPTLVVPLIYSLVLIFHYQINFSLDNLIQYLGEYYYSNNPDTSFGLINFMVTPITFFRTFFQVHGIVIEVLHLLPILYFIVPIVFLLILSFIVKTIKTISWKPQSTLKYPFEYTLLLIFALQFAFAFYSHGNSEFMVMLPFIIPLFIDHFFDYNIKAIVHISFAMLIWNFFFGVFPNNYFDYQNNKSLIAVIKNNPDKVFILKERDLLINQYYYEVGIIENDRFIDNHNEKAISNLQKVAKVIYSDILTKKVPFNRANVTRPSDVSNLVFIQHITKIESDLGGFYVDEVLLK